MTDSNVLPFPPGATDPIAEHLPIIIVCNLCGGSAFKLRARSKTAGPVQIQCMNCREIVGVSGEIRHSKPK